MGVFVDDGERLSGGEESAAYRSGHHVVRLGPTWRTTAELDWAYTVARQLAQTVAEVVAPLPTSDGRRGR